MAKKDASVVFLNDDNTRNCEWTVAVEDSGSISVYKDGKLEKNSKDALRDIADYIGFDYDEGWNTRQFGSKLVDYMNEEAAKDRNLKFAKNITVSELKKNFYDAFGACLRVYQGRSQVNDNTLLGDLGLKSEAEITVNADITVDSFCKKMFNQLGLKVKVYTCDEWVAVLDELTLAEAGKIKKGAVKADMEKILANRQPTKDNIDCSKTSDAGDEEAAEEGFTLEKQFASMCLNVACLDGEATPLEKRTFLELAKRQPELNYEEVETAFCVESFSPSDQDDIVYSVTNPVHQKLLYFGCAYTAICDKRLSAAEQKYLSLIAKIWHLDKEFCKSVTDKLIKGYSPVDIEDFVEESNWEDEYDRVGEVDGLSGYVVVKDEKFGFVDLSGNVCVSPRYERVCDIKNYCIAGLLNGKWGFLNYVGEEVIPPKYDDYNYLINGLVSVKSGKKWGVINSCFELIIPIEYERVGLIQSESKDGQKTGMLCCHKDEVMYIYDEQGKCISKFDYL